MAVAKNYQQREKKSSKTKNNSRAGRPSLPFYVKWQRLIWKKFRQFKKKISKSRKKLFTAVEKFAKTLGVKKGRGRPRLSLPERLARSKQAQRIERAKRNKQRRKRNLQFKRCLLKFFHLSKRAGRPKKRPVKKVRFKLKDLLFRKKEVAYVRLNLKRIKRLRIRFSFLSSLILTLAFLSASYSVYDLIFKDLPSANDLTHKEQNLTTRILDRQGQVLYRIYEDENRTLVPLNRVSDYLVKATIAIEDKNFYHHYGFDLVGISRALWKNLQGEKIQGGSTITQQLVKKRLLSDERTLKRKLRELLLSLVVEGVYTKDQILEMYLNTVPYGGSTYGIEETAWRYFNKPAADLNLAESALLAGLPQAPSIYSPFGPNPETAYARQAEVLRRMVEDGHISEEQAASARQEKLVFSENIIDIEAPHFVMYVKKLLAEMYGEDMVDKGGLEVRTTLDLNLQHEVQTIVSNEVDKLRRLQISNGAALVTNPKTGEILAMVGGANYFDFAHDGQVNVVLRPRQPGSSIKPLTYALAFETGQQPSSLIEDSAITYQTPGSKPYTPRNYDGKYHGTVSLREALASSYNIPAVKLLAKLGVPNLIDKGEELGISTWQDRSRFGLSLTLGGGEVLMIDMAELYSAFANLGYPVEPSPLLEVRDAKGKILYNNACAMRDSNCYTSLKLSPKAAYSITSILSDNRARSSAFGLFSVLNIPNQEVAVKTGTTNSMKDNWTIGYTSDRLVATWVGNNDNAPMSYVASGITGASPIWNQIFLLLLDEEAPHRFAMPANLVKIKICASTGTLPCGACPKITEEIFAAGTEPKTACSDQYFIDLAKQKELEAAQAAARQGQVF